jgi:hypothetical protein
MLKKLLLSLLAIIFVSLPIFISPPTTSAIEWIPGEDPTAKDVIDFCRRRQGNQMNLETWYSGKCNPKGSTYSGDQVGFADIFVLDIFERINGEDDGTEGLLEKLKNAGVTYNNIFNPNLETDFQASDNLKDNGLLNQVANLVSLPLKNPPANSASYIASVKQNLQDKKIVKEAIAADEGFGFNQFAPILPIWKAFRNIAYFLFVVIFIVMGFAIMFRVKINPQTVIGIQTILPKIIALLLLITFSYAIVGLMIDFMYVIFYLLINTLTAAGVIRSGFSVSIPGVGSVGGGQSLGVLLASGQLGIVPAMIYQNLLVVTIIPSAIAAAVTGIPIGITAIMDLFLTVTGIGLILRILLVIAVLYTFFKLFFKLVGAYINIVIQLIFAPIILLGGIFPGSKVIGNWFRNLLANMSVFPVTMILLLLSYVFMVQPLFNITVLGITNIVGVNPTGVNDLVNGTGVGAGVGGQGTGVLNAPLIFAREPGGANIMALIGIGLLLMASKYVDIIKEALQVPPFKHGSAIGEALMFGPQTIQKGLNTVVGKQLQQTGYGAVARKLGGGATPAGGFFQGLSDRYKPR